MKHLGLDLHCLHALKKHKQHLEKTHERLNHVEKEISLLHEKLYDKDLLINQLKMMLQSHSPSKKEIFKDVLLDNKENNSLIANKKK